MTEGWLGVEVVPRGPPLTRYRGSSPQGEPKPNVNRRGGFHIRPCNLAQPRNCQEGSRPLPTNQLVQLDGNVRFLGRMQASAPTATESCVLAPEGSIGEETKSVKKNAALLHFLGFFSLPLPFGVPRGERLAAHNERRQFAAQTRSCGYSPRWGEHCSLPSFATLNCGPLLATPQAPRPGFAASEQRDFFRFLFWSQKRKV